jgi:hypothetical protein
VTTIWIRYCLYGEVAGGVVVSGEPRNPALTADYE